jgi:acetyl-CoA carboxylase biotin carboxyl carrier protein
LFDIEKIQRLIEMMVENDLVEVSLRSGTEEINLRRPNAAAAVAMAPVAVRAPADPAPSSAPAAPPAPAGPPKEDAGLVSIASPMVGTFYVSSSPDSPPFVKVGDRVGPDSVVCILEAMKVFNEIKAETSGTIERILVKNGQAVEFGQPMFQVRPG